MMKTYPMTSILRLFIMFIGITLLAGCQDSKTVVGSPNLKEIQTTRTLVVGTAGDMPPFNMTTSEGDVIGFEADLAQNFADSLDLELRFEKIPFSELLNALITSKIHMVMSSMTIVPNRNAKVAFVGPYYVSGKAFLSKEKRIVDVASLKKLDIPEIRLTALKDSTSQAFVEASLPNAQLTAAASYDEAVNLVLEDKVHAMVADFPICAVSVMRYPDAGLLSQMVPLTYEPLGIALPPDDPHFVNWVENTLAILKANGTLKAIEERWFQDVSWLSQLP